MGGRRRVLSYVLVAVIAFSLGGTTRASAETGGLPALVEQVKGLATGLAAEVARAMATEKQLSKADADNAQADADEAKARQLYEAANDHARAANAAWQAAHELWVKRQEAINDAHEAWMAAHEARESARAARQAADIARQQVAKEASRAKAAEDAALAAALLAQAKAAEANANALERPVVVTDLKQLGGLACTAPNGQPGHTVVTIGADGAITFICVAGQ